MTMNPGIRSTALYVVLSLSGCGGSGGGSSANPGSGTSYAFTAPPLNSTRTYDEVIVDNSNNTVNISFSDTVTAANADGTYVVLSQDPSHSTDIVNGTNYAVLTETQTVNASGQQVSYGYTTLSGAVYSCTLDPHGNGPNFPLRVGQTWTLDYTVDCNSLAPVAYTQTGSVVDVESVTVPAGTYTAIKLQSTLTWTDALGTTRTQTVTNWRDVATSISVKETISITYGGTLPSNGYAVSREISLQGVT
jgi:hypothetical protein